MSPIAGQNGWTDWADIFWGHSLAKKIQKKIFLNFFLNFFHGQCRALQLVCNKSKLIYSKLISIANLDIKQSYIYSKLIYIYNKRILLLNKHFRFF